MRPRPLAAWRLDGWTLAAAALAALLLLPLGAVLLHLGRTGPEWPHLVDTVLACYLKATLGLVLGTGALVLLLALPAAWAVNSFEFPGRRIFSWLLVLPLAVPTYVAAFVYYQWPEAAIPWLVRLREAGGVEVYLFAESALRRGLLALTLAAVLYPYVYLAARTAFAQQGRAAIEAARCLGRRPSAVFFGVALPLARPALAAGMALVVMEVINDYGAVHFFGVPTLTEGIFRTWFGLGDRVSALRLAGIVMLVVLFLLAAEQALRGRARYTEPETAAFPMARRRLRGARAAAALATCLVPLALGLFYPVGRLLHWAWLAASREAAGPAFGAPLLRGLALSLVTALAVTAVAGLFAWAVRLGRSRGHELLGRAAGLGYATPGAVVAVGVMVVLGAVDRWFPPGSAWLLSGSLVAIGFAYAVRFFAIPQQFARAGLERVGLPLAEASRVLGRGPLATFGRVELPLIRGSLAAAAMLLFVDMVKELPLTLILRPANFDTLATLAYGLASEGRLQACALPALLIIASGALGLAALNHWLSPAFSDD